MPETEKRDPSEAEYALQLIEEIVRRCPRRVAASEDELRALEIMYEELQGLEVEPEWHDFETNRSLYAILALHFGIGVVGSLVAHHAPLAGAFFHALAGGSYWLDSTKNGYLLRKLGMTRRSRNLMVTLPAEGVKPGDEPPLRIVIMAHIDAAFTGLIFHPKALHFDGGPALLTALTERPLATATYSQLALVGLDLLRAGPLAFSRSARLASWALTAPALAAFLLSLEVCLKNTVVAGANDNLSGVAGMTLLGQRLRDRKPKDLELVLVVTGAEETGLIGSTSLARDMSQRWDQSRTVVLAMDSMCHGDMRVYVEGELMRLPLSPWLLEVLDQVAAKDARFANVMPYDVPAGGSDAMPFAAKGYDSLGFGRIDPHGISPRHYHWPTDTPENLDLDELIESVDFAEALIDAIVERRLG